MEKGSAQFVSREERRRLLRLYTATLSLSPAGLVYTFSPRIHARRYIYTHTRDRKNRHCASDTRAREISFSLFLASPFFPRKKRNIVIGPDRACDFIYIFPRLPPRSFLFSPRHCIPVRICYIHMAEREREVGFFVRARFFARIVFLSFLLAFERFCHRGESRRRGGGRIRNAFDVSIKRERALASCLSDSRGLQREGERIFRPPLRDSNYYRQTCARAHSAGGIFSAFLTP